MSNYHEPANELSSEARNFSRALMSLKEEIEAIDWYHQRVDVADNEELAGILAHNRDEEMEHACMALEWLRRNMPGWDEKLRTYLFAEGDILGVEEEDTGGKKKDDENEGNDLNIGKIK